MSALRVLIAEDAQTSRVLLRSLLLGWGYDVIAVGDGDQAWSLLNLPDPPLLAILDWDMPGLTGLDLCRRIRASTSRPQPYVILLTGKEAKDDILSGFAAGADDYVTKPFDHQELRVRVHAGQRIIELQAGLAARVQELETALAHVKQLRGLLPICSYCKKIRDDGTYWHGVEEYIAQHADVKFSHGICPDCFEKFVETELKQLGA